jgi:thiosulfate dehydrogenase [quinone] large subunit
MNPMSASAPPTKASPRTRTAADWALLPLRAFLGVTFTFAGLQKLANPAFFRSSYPASIQAQLLAASRHSPLHGLLHSLSHAAVAVGVLIALAELAVGLGTLVGLLGRLAAVGGILLSLGLFLTVSYHSNPYYTGADIVFAFAWLPFVVAGPGPFSLDAFLSRVTAQSAPAGQTGVMLDRRSLLLRAAWAAALAAVGAVIAGLAAGVGRLVGGAARTPSSVSLGAGAGGSGDTSTSTSSTSASTTTVPAGAPSSTAPAPTNPTTTQPPRPPGTRVGPASQVPVGGAATFQDPRSGDPAVVVRPSQSSFVAFDAVCPHAGCTVQYDPSQRLFVCPCHGSEFNGRTGAVEVGPAPSGLRKIPIAEGSDGNLYAR